MDTIEEIKKANMLIHGHDINSKPAPVNKSMAKLAFELVKLDLKAPNITLKALSKSEMRNSAKCYMESKLNIHNIHYFNPFLLMLLRMKTVSNVKELLELYNGHGTYINPFSLPVKYTKDREFYGLLVLQSAFYENDEFLKNMQIAFKHIELSRRINDITASCYLHEIMHTQLESAKGCIEDFNNSELLCMFMELVYALEASSESLLKRIEIDKLNYFFFEFDNLFKYYHENDGTINEFDALITSKYVISTLKAFQLFQIYYNGSSNIRKEMFEHIQSVIDGNMTLEDMLNLYSITNESSTNKSLIKHFTRK